ncbi:MAG: methyltransferase family protein [Terriglobales bacterium]
MTSRLQRWRVPLGFASAAALLLLAHPRLRTLALGLPIAVIGVALRAAAAGHIRKNDELATQGPYRYTRNPLYLGSSVLGAGLVIAAGSWWLALLAVLLLGLVYLPVIRQEERYLSARFGEAFQAYAARVPRLLPRWPARPAAASAGFSFALYRRHREYQALLGFAALALALILKWKLNW